MVIQQQQQRQIHFLPFLGLWGAKHMTAWTLYNACKSYGWPKVYRRLLEQNRILHRQAPGNAAIEEAARRAIRLAIEAPPKFAAQLSQHVETLRPLLDYVTSQAQPRLPEFIVAIAKFILNSQKPVKVVQDMMGAAGKAARR